MQRRQYASTADVFYARSQLAVQSRFPLVITILGWISLAAALSLAAMGFRRFTRFIRWIMEKVKPWSRWGGLFAVAFGAFLAITIPAFILGASDEGDSLFFALGLFVAGLGIMYASYRAFRYGEQYEYRHGARKGIPALPAMGISLGTSLDVKDVEEWIDLLN